eukprot:gene18715-biopygen9973
MPPGSFGSPARMTNPPNPAGPVRGAHRPCVSGAPTPGLQRLACDTPPPRGCSWVACGRLRCAIVPGAGAGSAYQAQAAMGVTAGTTFC